MPAVACLLIQRINFNFECSVDSVTAFCECHFLLSADTGFEVAQFCMWEEPAFSCTRNESLGLYVGGACVCVAAVKGGT